MRVEGSLVVKCSKWLSFAVLFSFITSLNAAAQTVSYPADGIYNGFLNQTNILECDNNNAAVVRGTLSLFDGSGVNVAETGFILEPAGSVHIILNDLAQITDRYGTYSINLDGEEELGLRVSCRTVFYRPAPEGSEKQYDFAYVIPVNNSIQGPTSGIFNSLNPGLDRSPVHNWLSVVNSSESSFSAIVSIFDGNGQVLEERQIDGLSPRGRIDIPLGHPSGETSGLYQITPQNESQDYKALLVRYGPHSSPGRFSFAFPLNAASGSCSIGKLFASTMASNFTQNWLELANPSSEPASVGVTVKDRFGGILSSETVTIESMRQRHIYLNAIIDPDGLGNVGTIEIECSDPDFQLLAQTTYYGSNDAIGNSWAYAVQGEAGQAAGDGSQLSLPMNTFLGMSNWIKVAEEYGEAANLDFMLFDSQGVMRSFNSEYLPATGSLDFDVHSKVAPNIVGSAVVQPGEEGLVSGHVLRTLPAYDGSIGSIVYIPASIQPFSDDFSSPTQFSGHPQSLAPYRDYLFDGEISHLLTRVSFGASLTERATVRNLGLAAQVSSFLNAPLNPSLNTFIADAEDVQWNEPKVAWMRMMIESNNPLQEKMALIWHDLFATSCRASNGNERCRDHVEVLRRNALGNFRNLAQEITIDHTMLRWLNGDRNTAEAPDENYSREFWELFTLGEASLHQGPVRLYNNQDITESSRSFTGWRTWSPDGLPVVFEDRFYDFGEKVVWEGTPYEVRGVFNQEDMVNLTLDIRPEASEWIAKRMFSALVHDHPDSTVVAQLAREIRDNNWDIKPALRMILQSQAFFSEDARGSRVKDAATYLVGFIRTTGIPYDHERYSWRFTHQFLGFEPTRPESVNGWPINKYQGASKSAYFLSWLTGYSNLINTHLNDLTGEDSEFDLLNLIPSSRINPTADTVVDELVALMSVELTADERAQLVQYVATDRKYNGEDQEMDLVGNAEGLRTKVTGVVWLLSQHRNYLTF